MIERAQTIYTTFNRKPLSETKATQFCESRVTNWELRKTEVNCESIAANYPQAWELLDAGKTIDEVALVICPLYCRNTEDTEEAKKMSVPAERKGALKIIHRLRTEL